MAHLRLAPSLTDNGLGPWARSPIRVVLTDDHASMRHSLRLLLEGEDGTEVIADTEDLASAMRYVKDGSSHVLAPGRRMPEGSRIRAASLPWSYLQAQVLLSPRR